MVYYSWIWDYFHDKGLLFQGQGLIAHKGDNSSGQGVLWCVFSSVLLGIGFSLCYAIGRGGKTRNISYCISIYRKVCLVGSDK